MTLLILACSATKRLDPGPLPAIERYDGPFYRVLRKALRERPGLAERLAVCIISAQHGIIAADNLILNYDRRMTSARAAELAPMVATALAHRWPPAYVEVGSRYRRALPPPPWPASVVVGHGGIGERLGQLKRWLWSIPL